MNFEGHTPCSVRSSGQGGGFASCSPKYISRGYKNRAISEKMFGTLAIFYDSLKGYFSTFSFFLLSDDS
jgi:hypothetical protein